MEGGYVLSDEVLCRIALSYVEGIGSVAHSRAIALFGSGSRAWHANPQQWQSRGFRSASIESLSYLQQVFDFELLKAKLSQDSIAVVTLDDDAYPYLLRQIHAPPPVLYLKGNISLLQDPAVTVVGSRSMTHYGEHVASNLSQDLACAGLVIVSGLMTGVDAIAHRAALAVSGKTIAVLGSGVDVIVPSAHEDLYRAIVRKGLVVSQFPLSSSADRSTFPQRDHVMAGLSSATLVVEAAERSGSLITARAASEYGRDVFAVPGSIFNPMSVGTNQLLSEGAYVVTTAGDVLRSFQGEVEPCAKKAATCPFADDSFQGTVFAALDSERSVDELARELSFSVDEVVSALTILEMEGKVIDLGGMRYAAKR